MDFAHFLSSQHVHVDAVTWVLNIPQKVYGLFNVEDYRDHHISYSLEKFTCRVKYLVFQLF